MNRTVRGKEFLKKKLTKENMLVLALLGVLCLVIAIPTGKSGKEEAEGDQKQQTALYGKETAGDDSGESQLSGSGARSREEERLEEILAGMEGVGKVQVMITWKESEEQVVEKDVTERTDSVSENDSAGGSRISEQTEKGEETVYITDADGRKSPSIKKTVNPKAEGVFVLAQGGGNPTVAKNITEAIEALFGLEAHKIKVAKMK